MKQHFIPKKKVLLIFKDGHQEIGVVKKGEKGIIDFYDRPPLRMDKLRSVSYYKPSPLSKGDTKH